MPSKTKSDSTSEANTSIFHSDVEVIFKRFSVVAKPYLRRHWYFILIIIFLLIQLNNCRIDKRVIIERDYPNERVRNILFPQKIIDQQFLDELSLKDVYIADALSVTKDNIPHLFGTLVNENDFEVYSVIIEINLYWDKNDPNTKFDTRFVNVVLVNGNSAYTFKEVLGLLNVPEDKPYDFTYKIVAATD